jgi:hypothetical protein
MADNSAQTIGAKPTEAGVAERRPTPGRECTWPLYPGHGGGYAPDGHWRLHAICPVCGLEVWGPVAPMVGERAYSIGAVERSDRIMERIYRRAHN